MKMLCAAILLVHAGLATVSVLAADAPATEKPIVVTPTLPTLTDAEKQAGWKLLFDGVSTAGWRGLGIDGFPDKAWEVKDGCLHCLGGKVTNDIIAIDKYDNFEISWEWMVPKLKGNSGLKYRVEEKKGGTFAFGCEYQMMYDPGVEGKDATASLYDVLPPVGKRLMAAGEFNQSRIIIQGNHVEHWLNGVKVLEFEFWNDSFKEAVAKSKFSKSATWAREPKGFIALQDHHDEVWFRNIKLRVLQAK